MDSIIALTKFILLALLLSMNIGCSNSPIEIEVKQTIKGAPDWVNKGSHAFVVSNDRLFYGVGRSAAMGDLAMQKAVSDDRARAEVSRILSVYLEVVAADIVNTTVNSRGVEFNLQSINLQLSNASKIIMSGARIKGSWRDKSDNTVWTIAELDLKFLKKIIAESIDIESNVKSYIESNAESIFDRVASKP